MVNMSTIDCLDFLSKDVYFDGTRYVITRAFTKALLTGHDTNKYHDNPNWPANY